MKRSTILFALSKIPLDIGVVFSAFFLARHIRSVTDLIPGVSLPVQTIPDISLLKFTLAGMAVFLLIQAFRKGYQIDQKKGGIELFLDAVITGLTWFLMYIALLYLGNEYLYHTEIPRLLVFFAFILIVFGTWFFRVCLALFGWILHKKKILSGTEIFLFGNDENDELREYFSQNPLYRVHTGDIKELFEAIRTNAVEEVMILSSIQEPGVFQEIVALSRIYGVKVRMSEGADGGILHHASLDFVGEHPVLSFHFIGLSSWGRVLKRIFDLIVSGFLLILLLPVWIIVGLLIFLGDGGSPFYKSVRIGKGGREFFMYKFRSMKQNAEQEKAKLIAKNERKDGPLFKIENDPRITAFGRFIRKFDIDELPQLYNVFRGDMSLVGPRPHLPEEVSRYKEFQKQVLTLKPGITGMAQTHGRHKNTFDQEVQLDTYYIENWSVWLDVQICLRTFLVILFRESV